MKPEDAGDLRYPTLLEEVESKQEQLDVLLVELSEIGPGMDDARVREIGEKMFDIYKTDLRNGLPFRHQYHYFLGTLQSIQYPDYIDALMANPKVVIHQKEDDITTLPMLLKLYDHISIDVVRMATVEETHSASIKVIRTAKSVDKLESTINSTQKKVDSLQMETVAILGVFAAIVIGFAGGLDVIGGTLSNVGSKDFQLIIFSVSLTGLVLFDVVWLLMECVFRIAKDRAGNVVPPGIVAMFNGLMITLMACASIWQT